MTSTAVSQQIRHLALQDFEPLVGTSFDLVAADHRMTITLVEARSLGDHVARTAARAPFSLMFHAPATPVYPQNVYRLEHPAIGAHLLLTAPLGPSPNAPDIMRYQILMA